MEIKDEKDRARWRLRIIMNRASWSETGADGSLLGIKDEKDRAMWRSRIKRYTRHIELRMKSNTRQMELRMKMTRASWNNVFGQV